MVNFYFAFCWDNEAEALSDASVGTGIGIRIRKETVCCNLWGLVQIDTLVDGFRDKDEKFVQDV